MKRKPPSDSASHRDPYKPARRPPAGERSAPFRGRSAEGTPSRPAYGRGRPADDEGRPSFRPRASEAGGFTVVLDPDVARVFRGAASVNKALRLVMQLNQVVQGPPQRPGAARPRFEADGAGRRHSAGAARFNDDDEQ